MQIGEAISGGKKQRNPALLVDGHVHAWRESDLGDILLAAHANFSACAADLALDGWLGVLLLADPEGVESAGWLARLAEEPPSRWQALAEADSCLSTWTAPDGSRLVILRGYQVATAEGLEVLAFGVRGRPARRPAGEIVADIRAEDGLAVIPWGAGKWLGERRRCLLELMTQHDQGGFLLGDNGGRPWFWPEGRVFGTAADRSIPKLPGSDPLPLPEEPRRVGSIGALLDAEAGCCDSESGLIRRILQGGWQPYGRPMGAIQFVSNQLRLRSGRHDVRQG